MCYDLDLKSGDFIVLSLKDGEWSGFSELERVYFESALKISVFIGENNKQLESQEIQFAMPDWVEVDGSLVPINKLGSYGSVRFDEWSGLSIGPIKRGEKSSEGGPFTRARYWPRNGDVIYEGPRLRGSPPSKPPIPTKTSTSPKKRARYVPRPK